MTAPALLEILDALRNRVDPRTGEHHPNSESCLSDARVRRALNALIRTVAKPEPSVADGVDIPDAVIEQACAGLRELGYEPCVAQLAKVFIGSRSIADRSLKGLAVYNCYRGVYSRAVIHTHLLAFHRRFPDVLPELPPARAKRAPDPWKDVDFFRVDGFDKMDAAREADLRRAVTELGLRKTTDRLPAYMVTARNNHPRAFEPWGREEQALLIEAMCYTNDLDRLATVFGRTARSLEGMGQRLIFESKQRNVA